MKTKCSRLIRVIEAIMCFVVGCALLLMLDPSMRHLLADVFLRPHSEVAIEQTVSSPGPMRQPTERICRFHGTEWDTRIEYVKASPKEVIDAMDKAYAALPQASCPAFLPMARALAAASVPLDSYVIESNSITRVYGSLPVGGETGRRGGQWWLRLPGRWGRNRC